jgi:putative methyltransferase (TIGR04325 family)
MPDSLKQYASDWIPPGAIRIVRLLMDFVRQASYEYVPEGWVREKENTGWNSESVADSRRRQWDTIQKAYEGAEPLGFEGVPVNCRTVKDLRRHNLLVSFAYVLALAARCKKVLRVLDWGGDIGSYRLLSEAVLKGVPIDYHCAEVAAVCRAGRELNPGVSFWETNEWSKERYDLVLASSAINYVKEWKSLINDLAKACAGYLYITRLPIVHDASSFVVIQRAYGTAYQGWIINRQELLNCVLGSGVSLIREFVNHDGPRIHNAPEQPISMGFLFRKGQD